MHDEINMIAKRKNLTEKEPFQQIDKNDKNDKKTQGFLERRTVYQLCHSDGSIYGIGVFAFILHFSAFNNLVNKKIETQMRTQLSCFMKMI